MAGKGCYYETAFIYYPLEMLSYVALPIGIVCYLAVGRKLSRRNGVASGAQRWSPEAGRASVARSTAVGRVRLLAICFVVNALLLAPLVIMTYHINFFTQSSPPTWLIGVAQILFVSAAATNPLVYALVSADMRRAMWRCVT